ncbi:MAG: hypothetical protein MK033_03145 [Candidatus Caenarcaniphilales bacterium]|nr:hypothetical protein [Candidatus Caenarcaniphilales bacterium]
MPYKSYDNLIDITTVVLSQDNARTLGKCLKSVVVFSKELIVIDYGGFSSGEAAAKISKNYTHNFHHMSNIGWFHLQKRALDLCSHNWVFFLCADEMVSPSLEEEIREFFKSSKSEAFQGFRSPRKLYIGNDFLRWGGNYPDHQLRLFRNGSGKFRGVGLEDGFEIWNPSSEKYSADDPSLIYTSKQSLHYSPYLDITEMREVYAGLAVTQESPYDNEILATMLAILKFIELYILKLGFLDLTYGYDFAEIEMNFILQRFQKAKESAKFND